MHADRILLFDVSELCITDKELMAMCSPKGGKARALRGDLIKYNYPAYWPAGGLNINRQLNNTLWVAYGA